MITDSFLGTLVHIENTVLEPVDNNIDIDPPALQPPEDLIIVPAKKTVKSRKTIKPIRTTAAPRKTRTRVQSITSDSSITSPLSNLRDFDIGLSDSSVEINWNTNTPFGGSVADLNCKYV